MRGAESCLESRARDGTLVHALYLGPEEHFTGTGLVSATRALVASDHGLYLFDRTRELYLLDYQALAPIGDEPVGGDLFAHAERVFVLGPGTLACFRTR